MLPDDLVPYGTLSLAELSALALLLALVLAASVGTALASRSQSKPDEATALPSAESFGLLARTRRSVFPKDYTGAAVPRAVIERALGAANWAPTHGKTEPWRFVVFEGAAAISRLQGLKREGIGAMMTGEKRDAALAKAASKDKELLNCSAVIAICVKRVANAKGGLMPEWEETAATACAVQNLHLALQAEGSLPQGGRCVGYWSSGGVGAGGWADAPAVRSFLGMDGSCEGSPDQVLGFFHVGVAAPEKLAGYKARRGPIEAKTTWVLE